MKPADVHGMSDGEIVQAVTNARQELFNLRFQQTTGRLSDTSRLRTVRRDLARLLTVSHERELWAAYQAAKGEEA